MRIASAFVGICILTGTSPAIAQTVVLRVTRDVVLTGFRPENTVLKGSLVERVGADSAGFSKVQVSYTQTGYIPRSATTEVALPRGRGGLASSFEIPPVLKLNPPSGPSPWQRTLEAYLKSDPVSAKAIETFFKDKGIDIAAREMALPVKR